MGTFHEGKGELHGITVLVRTPGTTAYLGRCDTVTEEGVVLLDADVYEGRADDLPQDAWIRRAARVGVWKKFDEVFVPAGEVSSIERLADLRIG